MHRLWHTQLVDAVNRQDNDSFHVQVSLAFSWLQNEAIRDPQKLSFYITTQPHIVGYSNNDPNLYGISFNVSDMSIADIKKELSLFISYFLHSMEGSLWLYVV